MTNEQKYKTPEERAEAFSKFCCISRKCDDCACAKQGKKGISLCEFKWLTLEAEEEKPLPCPFCGSKDIKVIQATVSGYVATCNDCWAASRAETTKADAVAAWNRRAK